MRKKKDPRKDLFGIPIHDAASDGRGVGRHENMVVFVPFSAPGDVLDIAVTGKKKKFYEGRILNIVEPSPDRTEPFCDHFGTCGGCKWQHMNYSAQLKFKQKQVNDVLTRISGLELPEAEPILGANNITRYRNKMVYTFSPGRWLTYEEAKKDDSAKSIPAVGFHVPGGFDKVVHVTECHLQHNKADQIRMFVYNYCMEHGLESHNIRSHEGLVRNVMIRNTSIDQWMVVLVFGENSPERFLPLMQAISDNFELTSLAYIVNEKLNDSFDDQEVVVFKGEDHLIEELEGYKFKVSPKSFFQTNTEQALGLYSVVREFAGLTGNEVIYDLYSGTGSIGIFLSAAASKVVGVEYVQDAVDDAWYNAKLNNLSHCSFFAGDMKEVLNNDFIAEHGKPDVLITDPPRTGMHEDVVKKILELASPRVVYVSCNPATQARDLELLQEKYKVVRIKPVDMFPHTHHVENVALLELK